MSFSFPVFLVESGLISSQALKKETGQRFAGINRRLTFFQCFQGNFNSCGASMSPPLPITRKKKPLRDFAPQSCL